MSMDEMQHNMGRRRSSVLQLANTHRGRGQTNAPGREIATATSASLGREARTNTSKGPRARVSPMGIPWAVPLSLSAVVLLAACGQGDDSVSDVIDAGVGQLSRLNSGGASTTLDPTQGRTGDGLTNSDEGERDGDGSPPIVPGAAIDRSTDGSLEGETDSEMGHAVSTDESGSTTIDPTRDRDGDGLSDKHEIERYGTSPIVADTDGDGFTDRAEVLDLAFDPDVDNFQFNPLIADRPVLDVELAAAPVIYATYATSDGSTEIIGKERSEETRLASSRSWGGSNSHSVERSHTTGGEAGFEGWKLKATVKHEWSYATANGTSTEWSREQAVENGQTRTTMDQFEQSNTISSSGGVLGVTVRVSNRGDIAYFLDNLTLSAYELSPFDPDDTSPIGVLTLLDLPDTFPRIRLEPGQTSSPMSFAASLDLPTAKSLLEDSSTMMIGTATSEIQGDGTVNFELASTSINARTAEVTIDYGFGRERETYRVSTVAREGETSVTVDEVMTNILRIPYTQGVTQLRAVRDGDPIDTYPNLLSVRGLGTSDEESTMWTVIHSYPTENGASRTVDQYHPFGQGLEFGALRLQKAHVLELIRIVDTDRDGLGERSEFAYGTDPDDPDTDGDGCEDGFEVNGWEVGSAPHTVRYRSNPLSRNTDSDLYDDCDEYEAGTDPSTADDTAPTAAVSVAHADGAHAVFEVAYGDAETDVQRLIYRVNGGVEQTLDVSDVPSPARIPATFAVAGTSTFSVTSDDGKLRSQPAEVTYTFGAPEHGLASHWPVAGATDDAIHRALSDSLGGAPLKSWGAALVGGRDGVRSGADVRPGGSSGIIFSEPRKLGDDFTLSFWISLRDIYGHELVAGQSGRFAITASGNTFDLFDMHGQTYTGQPIATASSNGFENDGRFHHIAVTVRDHTAELYVDGEGAGSGELATAGRTSECPLFFGDQADGRVSCGPSQAQDHENGLNASFDDVRLYDRALSAHEVQALWLD